MTGIDTNVLVRYITRDHPEQYKAAKRHLESNCTQENPGYVTVIVLCELAWVLDSAYNASDEEVARAIDQVLRTRHLQVQSRDQVRAALAQYKGSGADFPDCLVGQLCLRAGSDETVTFDRAAARLSHWRELEW
ncbi:PIN domain-containing protein [Salinibacter sp.]|uniref:PIN domain-containing protein n=1 Tax=Salinibacter sp. TaxID=2065818 RepID=UPI0021E8389E|nr:type II toxin-antitoxin system VapC family toxin [Salinibacter sp.]